jgi:long-chain acyl-CoA synthetase
MARRGRALDHLRPTKVTLVQPGRSTVTIPEDAPDHPTMVHALDAAAELQPDRVALIVGDDQVTFSQYRRAVGGMAAHLVPHVKRGDTVALVMANSIEMAVADFGAQAACAQVAPLNPNLTDRELTPLLRDVDPAVVLCSPHVADRATALAGSLGYDHVEIVGEGGIDIWAWTDDPSCRLPEHLPSPDDRASMFFTGGTTGLPKGAEHTHRSTLAFCRTVASVWHFGYDREVILNVAPMFHIWGHHYSVIEPLYLRATAVVVPQYQPDIVLDLLERHRITLFAGGPAAIYVGMLNSPRINDVDLSSLRYSLAGGAPCPEALLRRWKELTGHTILEGWGMSEGAPINHNPSHGRQKLMSTGITPADTEIDIVDLETGTRVLPVGERGEIRVRGPQFTKGYRNRPDETAKAIRDGWLYTGDIGYFDEDGYMFLVDRKKELIIVGGYNVYPREIDELLTNHPKIAEAAAVGVPDDFSGEAVRAYVALRPGEEISIDELRDYCSENLVKYKRPRDIVVLDELPKKGPGKIDKLTLKAMAD